MFSKRSSYLGLWGVFAALALVIFQNFENIDDKTQERILELGRLSHQQKLVEGQELDQISRDPALMGQIFTNQNLFKNGENLLNQSVTDLIQFNRQPSSVDPSQGAQVVDGQNHSKSDQLNFVQLNRLRYRGVASQIDLVASGSGTNIEYRQGLSPSTGIQLSHDTGTQATSFSIRYGF
ncbi:MAG TPA: hypothetical protein PLU50_00060 [Pseudobdellovibrionaceae bacterium]|jgi:hypothetical protein|nr:hypothetical protein [Pseudobdellovibrionaceae bacterium]